VITDEFGPRWYRPLANLLFAGEDFSHVLHDLWSVVELSLPCPGGQFLQGGFLDSPGVGDSHVAL
jgi:hypothetical protein